MLLGGVSATYQGGHPELTGINIKGYIRLTDNEFEFLKETFFGSKKLFSISFSKIKSVTTDIEKEWSGTRLAVGWLFFGPLGAMFFGKKKTEQLGLVVGGSDGEGNTVEIPVVFAPVGSGWKPSGAESTKLKALLNEKIAKAKGVKI